MYFGTKSYLKNTRNYACHHVPIFPMACGMTSKTHGGKSDAKSTPINFMQ